MNININFPNYGIMKQINYCYIISPCSKHKDGLPENLHMYSVLFRVWHV